MPLTPWLRARARRDTATVAELDNARNHEESRTKSQPKTAIEVSSTYSLAQGLVAVFQTLYASATLYRARGDQIKWYGYAAFGLTVAPYLVMSVVNLISTILTPNYPTTFMVESEIMREAARRDGARFNGIVGMLGNDQPVAKDTDMVFKIDEQGRCFVRRHGSSSSSTVHGNTATGFEEAMEVSRQPWLIELDPVDNDPTVKRIVLVPASYHHSSPHILSLRFAGGGIILWLSFFVGLISLVINGVLTRFKAGNSTHAQRVWTMTWLAFGIMGGSFKNAEVKEPGEASQSSAFRFAKFLGVETRMVKLSGWKQRSELRFAEFLGVELTRTLFDSRYAESTVPGLTWTLTIVFVYGAIAIGGFVVVCQMLLQYGNCTQIY